ncbi:hypothetical protein AAW50_03530 [Mycoplasmopsis canis]|uniref:hypothetical protein n=1 Tax=Mycoplasmopsis canis TaxID=29555 RepID=UPI000624493D|nr:hypothetical protein [Mycoplasmopsis canis]AKF41025.1 hypothetical protein AAW50_01045 [Mycoplasmopsis canis]AKF41460.1 hypothetical protein AAW50_03530 [Mycoplasmopsis canis]
MLLITTTPEIKSVVLKDEKKGGSKSLFNLGDLLSSFFIDILGDIIIDVLTVAFLPLGAGALIIRAGAKFVKNIVTALARTGTINWTNTFTNLGFDLLLVGASFATKTVLNTSRKLAKTNKLAKAFYNTYTTTKQGLEFVKKDIVEKIADASKKILEPIQKSARASQRIKNLLQPQKISFLLQQGKEAYQAIKNPLSLITKGTSKLKNLTNERVKKVIEKQGLKFWTSIAQRQAKNGKISDALAKKYTKALSKFEKGQIYFNSRWVSGVRVYNPKYWEQSRFISFFLYFKREATTTKNAPKGKRPLELVMPISKYFDFINSVSKGRYYLENIAWGWILGKGKRVLNNITFNSFDELYSSKDFEKFRFQIHKPEKHKQALLNDLENIKRVKKHRTNKTQKVAFAEKMENGKIKISFAKNVKDFDSNIYTKQTVYKKQKRR